ncbi:MAG: stage V sporulation protein AD [Bacillota bacterium]|jgi:stage V sporulation protein AD
MAQKKMGAQTWQFQNPPLILETATVVGPLEGQGPLGDTFDLIYPDQINGQKSFEACERALMKDAVHLALDKAKLSIDRVDYMLAGDLLNQIISSNFAARDLGLPFLGLYGACSGMAESLGLAAALVDAGYADYVVAAVSSHYGASERQFRYPTEYGGQKPPYAQNTVTGAGAALVANRTLTTGRLPQVTHFTVGRVLDRGIKDPFDMGSAMAPAAADTLQRHLQDTGRQPEDYDLILTGDLATVGKRILIELMDLAGIDLRSNYDDCGCRIYDRHRQPVFAGGSGCACSAAVVYGSIMQQMLAGELNRVLAIATGALLSPTTFQQGESIPCIAHAVAIEMAEERGDGNR